MPVSSAIGVSTSPVLIPAKTRNWFKEQNTLPECRPARSSMEFQPSSGTCLQLKLSAPGPFGLGLQLQPIDRRRRALSGSFICASSSQGQTQTVTREAPTTTITNAPANEKSPKLDDGGTGFPPRDDDGGGGGGGGGGGNWSGGFFLFGFLAFLGFLKDKESDEKYRDSRRR